MNLKALIADQSHAFGVFNLASSLVSPSDLRLILLNKNYSIKSNGIDSV